MTIEELESIATAVFTALALIISGMNWYNNKKKNQADKDRDVKDLEIKEHKEKVEESELIVKNAMQLFDRFDKLAIRLQLLEDESIVFQKRIKGLENALLESSTYKYFFELSRLASVILTMDGKIYDSNLAFQQLYGYTAEELSSMTIYDVSAEPDKTKESITKEEPYIENRLHRNKHRKTFLVDVNAVYYTIEDMEVKYIYCIFIPKVKAKLSSRIQDVLDTIVERFYSDYSTLWVIHNGGSKKISAMYESVKFGNTFLFQDYKKLPSTIFEDLFAYLLENDYLFIKQKDENFDSLRMTMKHADLSSIILFPIKEDETLIGLLSTSWRSIDPVLLEDDIKRMIKYSESELLKEAVNIERHCE